MYRIVEDFSSKHLRMQAQKGNKWHKNITEENLTCMLDNVVQCPPGTFGFIGIKKMYFQ